MKTQYSRLNGTTAHASNRRLFLSIISVSIASVMQANTYSIQIGAYPSPAEAQNRLASYSTTCSPAFVHVGTGEFPYKACIGKFGAYADAWASKSRITGLPSDAFLTTVSLTAPPTDENVLPIERPFSSESLGAPDPPEASDYWKAGGFEPANEPGQELLEKPTQQLTHDELIVVGFDAPRNEVPGVPALERFVAENGGDPQTRKGKLHLARVLGRGADRARAHSLLAEVAASGNHAERVMAAFLRGHVRVNEKNHAEAFTEFRTVAGDPLVPYSLRMKAMEVGAASLHAQKRYVEAWLAFDQVADHGTTTSRASALVQQAGLAFELTKSAKGTWNEVRALCYKARTAEGSTTETRAVSDLMTLETHFEERDYETALAQCNTLIATYPQQKREQSMAILWKGIILHLLDRDSEARAALEPLMITSFGPGDEFAQTKIRARAGVWLARICEDLGDADARRGFVDLLKAEFPGSEEANHADRMFPNS